jgi:eukaryotic-like serine/threonine-protein kinase
VESEDFGERYRVIRRLGAGGMGIVYEALDRVRDARVAIKTMQLADAAALYRFKNEFRALADLTHRNLVTLHELVAEGRQTFFTMEYVEGVDLLQHLRGTSVSFEAPTQAAPGPTDDVTVNDAPPVDDFASIYDVFGQLALGLHALHIGGKLHRDVKPTNVMVTRDGRVVLLDFGLVSTIGGDANAATVEHHVVGTPEYMSPEQGAGLELTAASDWYAVGVMLYEALVGRRPFTGPRLKLLMDKQMRDALPPRSLNPRVPAALDDLCVALLQREPRARPTGEKVLESLSVIGPTTRTPASLSTLAPAFVGRTTALAQLDTAFEHVRRARAAVVHLHGRSGMGKSTLVRRFLDLLAVRGEAVALTGRCYERESVPYKALDAMVDALSRFLRRLPAADVARYLPREIFTLTRVFPVLLRVDEIARALRPAHEIPDPQELRRRAFRALRELLARIADATPVVLWIDDLQWGDVDSAGFLADLLRPPDAPALLLLVSYRSEDIGSSPLVDRVREEMASLRSLNTDEHPYVDEVSLGPLSPSEAAELAHALVGGDHDSARHRAAAISREAQGSPLFVAELAHDLLSRAGATIEADAGVKLETLLRRRADALPASARALLEVIAVAGRPISRAIAVQAAGLDDRDEATAVALLRTGHLARTLRTRDRDDLEAYHDRIREVVAQGLAPDAVASHHRRIAQALATIPGSDPEALATHFFGGGDLARAAEYALIAADRASEALAFDRAARLYRLSLDARGSNDVDIKRKLGDALANAGRGREAADIYRRAAVGTPGAIGIELKRRAAEELLKSGHVDEGLAAIREVLDAVGMKVHATPRRALLSAIALDMYLRVRGYGFRERHATEIAPHELQRIDILWSVSAGLAVVDNIRAIAFSKRQLVAALRAGEPHRVARVLAAEVCVTATPGRPSARRTQKIISIARPLAERLGDPRLISLLRFTEGAAAFLEGRWRDAQQLTREAFVVMRDQCTGMWWERANAIVFELWSLTWMGDLAALADRLPALLAEARERGDLYFFSNLRTGRLTMLWLAADDPTRAIAEATDAVSQWSQRETHLQHYYASFALAQAELYRGDAAAAFARINGDFPRFQRALIFRIQSVRIEALHLRARAAIAAAFDSPDPEAMLASAEKDARAIARERAAPWAEPMALLDLACVASARGDTSAAVASFGRAIPLFVEHAMLLDAAVCKRAHGQLIGGDEGRAEIAEADAFLAQQRVRDPDRMTDCLVPRRPVRSSRLLAR